MKEKIKQPNNASKKRLLGFQVVEDKCIWMKAGIVNFRLCDNAYDCNNCPFDLGMRKTMNLNTPSQTQQDSPGWVEYLRERYHGSSRPCRHTLTGRVNAPKKCIMNYECYHCAYEQLLDEEDLVKYIGDSSYKKVFSSQTSLAN